MACQHNPDTAIFEPIVPGPYISRALANEDQLLELATNKD